MTKLGMHNVAVLGATGSIGTATLDVLQHLDRVDAETRWNLWAASGHSDPERLHRLLQPFKRSPSRVVLSNAEAAKRLGANVVFSDSQIMIGPEALVEVAQSPEVHTVVAAIVGRAGLESTLAAVHAGKRVALANKETLVVAGELVRAAMAKSNAELLPIDSEHSAIFQCIGDRNASKSGDYGDVSGGCGRAKKLILTASGGPFRCWTAEQMASATPAAALEHPTWEMGSKITIDSATMMNKALEVIEARWLFDLPAEAIEVVVHPQSIIHSMVEFEDGSVIAQLSPPDMRLPIQYALTWPRRLPCQVPTLNRDCRWDLSIEPVDRERFPALDLGFEVARIGGTAGAVVNAANEHAVGLFLDGKIRFTDIVTFCWNCLNSHHFDSNPTLEGLLRQDRWARAEVQRMSATNF